MLWMFTAGQAGPELACSKHNITTLRYNANCKPPMTDKHLVTVFQARHQLLCCTAFAHVWLASQLAAAWRSVLLRFGARLSNDGPGHDTTAADLPIYDWPQTAAAGAFA